ncbi:metal-dependent transcriptional regulator [Bacteroidota bacterium]
MHSEFTFAEENYLKAIYHLSKAGQEDVSTNAIAELLHTKPASVSDMIQKLAKKELVNYKKYRGVNITNSGKKVAIAIIRKHRLWEVFLVEKLKFHWDEVHEVAEELEHIRSPLLVNRLEEFLDHPQFDPHGDPIPDADGKIKIKPRQPLCDLGTDDSGVVVNVTDSSNLFLQYLDKLGIKIGTKVKIVDKIPYDGSIHIILDGKKNVSISKEVSENLLVTS